MQTNCNAYFWPINSWCNSFNKRKGKNKPAIQFRLGDLKVKNAVFHERQIRISRKKRQRDDWKTGVWKCTHLATCDGGKREKDRWLDGLPPDELQKNFPRKAITYLYWHKRASYENIFAAISIHCQTKDITFTRANLCSHSFLPKYLKVVLNIPRQSQNAIWPGWCVVVSLAAKASNLAFQV